MDSTRWKTNLILLVLLAGLTLLTIFSQDEEIKDQLSTITADKATSIQIVRKNSTVELKKKSGSWIITRPLSIRANQFRINTLLEILSATVDTRYRPDEFDLTSIGLDAPTVTLEIDDDIFEFGTTNPVSGKRFIRYGDSIVLIDDRFYPLINSQIGTLIDLKLLPDDFDITKIQSGSFELSMDADHMWKSETNISADQITEIIDNWKGAQAFAVHTYMKRDQGSDAVTIYDRDRAIRFTIESTDPWLILGRPDLKIEYHFDQSMFKGLFSTLLPKE